MPIVGDLCGYFFRNVRDKTSNITSSRYATPCLPVIYWLQNECPRMTLSANFTSKSAFDQQGGRALTFALARLSCNVFEFSVQESCAIAKMTARCALQPISMLWKILGVRGYAHSYFHDIFNGVLVRSIPWLCVQNLNFVPLPAPEIGLKVIDWSFGWGLQSTIFRKRRS